MPTEQEMESDTIYLDADVAAWLLKGSKDYEARANQMLRERMLAEMKRDKPSRT